MSANCTGPGPNSLLLSSTARMILEPCEAVPRAECICLLKAVVVGLNVQGIPCESVGRGAL